MPEFRWHKMADERPANEAMTAIEITPPTSLTLTIDMTKLDEICERARGFKEIVLRLDGKEHRYRPEDVLEILRGIEL